MKKKIFVIAAILTLAVSAAMAMPVRPGKILYTQPDGTVVEIYRHGDEWGHYTTNAQGQVVKQDADGFYRVMEGVDAGTAARAASMRRKAMRQHSRARSGEHIALGQKHFLVILVEFSDLSFTVSNPKSAFSELLNTQGYSTSGGTGSARDYYYDNSHGKFEPIFDVYGPVKLSKTMAYYGSNDSDGYDQAPEQAIIDACSALKSQIIFADYDNDADGEVDLVFMYYAGYGEADGGSEDTIWPHQWELSSAGKSFSDDGKKVDKYACTNELVGTGALAGKMCGIGTACHEFGHAMGLPDFYDTDYDDNGEAAALFDFSLMCGGGYNNEGRTPPYLNIVERIMLGWIEEANAIQAFSKNGQYTLKTVHEDFAYSSPTDMEGEFFLYECRSAQGWDQYVPAEGLIVYHVDRSSRLVNIGSSSVKASELWSSWESYNAINENGKHPCFYIIPAADQSNLMFGYEYYPGYGYYYNSANDPLIPFPGSKKVTSYTPKSWNGVSSSITLSSIAYGSGTSTFTVSGVPSSALDYHVIANPGKGVYTAGSSFTLALEEAEDRPVASVSWTLDNTPVSGASVVLTAGSHVIEATVKLQDGRTEILTLELTAK